MLSRKRLYVEILTDFAGLVAQRGQSSLIGPVLSLTWDLLGEMQTDEAPIDSEAGQSIFKGKSLGGIFGRSRGA